MTRIVTLIPAALTALGCHFADAADSEWLSPRSGSFTSSSFWSAGVPGSADRAIFGSLGSPEAFVVEMPRVASNRRLEVVNQSPWLLFDPGDAYSLMEEIDVGSLPVGASLVLAGGAIDAPLLRVGRNGGSGSVTIDDGAVVTVDDVRIGASGVGSGGTVLVSGPGSRLVGQGCCNAFIGEGEGGMSERSPSRSRRFSSSAPARRGWVGAPAEER